MSDSPTLCVADSNILIDLHNGVILDLLPKLPYRIVVPDAVKAELRCPSPGSVAALGFEIGALAGPSVLEAYEIRQENPRFSVADLFALLLARDRGAMLLTGDGHLRRLARERSLVVHGVLWVLEEMVRLDVLRGQGACEALDAMILAGARLPAKACQRLRRRWKK